MIWLLFILLLGQCRAVIYLWTREGRVVISSKEYAYHSSELKLLCLCSAYQLGSFQASMLALEEATSADILQLPTLFWRTLSSQEFVRVALNLDIAQLLNQFVSSGNLDLVWVQLREGFKKNKRMMSRQLRPESLSMPALKLFLNRLLPIYDPYHLLLQASPSLASILASIDVLDPIEMFRSAPFSLIFFGDDQHWTGMIVRFLELRFQGQLSSTLDAWQYFEDNYKQDVTTMNAMKHIMEDLLDDLDLTSMNKDYIRRCVRMYTRFDGLAATLGLYAYQSRLKSHIETELDLADREMWNLVWPLPFQVVGETMLLLGQATGRVHQMETIPEAFEENYPETVKSGYAASGWVTNVAVASTSMQTGLFWAITWKNDFNLPLGFAQEWLDNFDAFDSAAFPMLPLLHFMQLHPEEAGKLRVPRMNSRNRLDIRLLEAIIQLILGYPLEHRDDEHDEWKGTMPEKREHSHWRLWSVMDWKAASLKELFDLVMDHGLARIYNHLWLMDAELARQIFTPDLFHIPRFSASIRFGDVQDDLDISFATWIMPLIDEGSFYSTIRPEDIEKLSVYWRKLGLSIRFEDFAGQPGPSLVSFIGDVIIPALPTCVRRPIDIVQDRLTVPVLPSRSALVFAQITESYWRDLASHVAEFGVSEQDLMDFWTCPNLRKSRLDRNPFWRALHQVVDISRLGPRHWELITLMVVDRELEVLLATAYLAGIVCEFPANTMPGLPLPSWMSDFPQEQRLAYLEPHLKGNMKLQEALIMMIKWKPETRLPESLVDWIVCNYWRPGMRYDLGLLALNHALQTPFYSLPEDMPTSSGALARSISFIQTMNI